jgi:hypothetical protein
MPAKSALEMWTIYAHPRDDPAHFVARRWRVGERIEATSETFAADTLAEVRALLPPGLTCLSRAPDDDPVIVECWI